MARPVKLKDYLSALNVGGTATLPWAHSTSANNLMDIIADGKLLATPCKVFGGDKLCYLFVGRPAFKMKDAANPSTWQLPVAFVIRFHKPPPIKRVFPFDSGAFHDRRLPSYLTMFKMEGYNLSGDPDQIGRLISFYFKSQDRYFHRRPATQEEIQEHHNLNMSHQEILALSRLYHEGSSPEFDDRAAAIEIQVEQDIELRQDNLLGIVMPAEFARVPELMRDMTKLTKNIETYDIMPLGLTHHFALLYQGVKTVYKRAGINIDA